MPQLNIAFKLCCHLGCALKPLECIPASRSLSELVKNNTLQVCLGGKVKPSLALSGSSSWRKFPRGYHWLATSQLAKRASQTCERKCKRQTLSTSGVATVIHPSNVRSHAHEYILVRALKLMCQQPSRISQHPTVCCRAEVKLAGAAAAFQISASNSRLS